jgi:asparagine synthase (glutamine-hydrolysing)
MGKDAEGIYSYTLGLPGCADQKLAERMAGVTGTRHTFIPLEKSYLQNFNNMAARMIVLSDGMYHPHESTEMLALDYFKHANFKILLRGHGGEIAKAALAYPVMVRPQVHQIKTSDEILSYILNITNLVIRDIPHDALFSPFFKDIMAASPSNSLKSSIGEVSHWLAPADVCIYYYINEHIRRQVVASLEIFRNLIEIRLPYIDENFLKYLLLLPVNERNRGEIHRRLIQKCKPELIKIPDSNTGAPLDAGPAKLFLKDKFNSLMKKLSVRGFRHYTEFQNWHRKGFKESSQQIIFNDKTESRGLYNMDYLKSVFNLHISGEKDYAHLLGTIVGIELWYRQFVDNNL